METISTNQKVQTGKKMFAGSKAASSPEWISDLCDYWLHVISRFEKSSSTYIFYHKKIRALQSVIRPASVLGVENWVNARATPGQRRKDLKNHIEGTIKIIEILSPDKNPIYLRALKELRSLLDKVQ